MTLSHLKCAKGQPGDEHRLRRDGDVGCGAVGVNHYYLSNPRFGYDMERIRNTAEHELGHAIGLAHNEGQSVMQSAGSYLSIQPEDVVAVRKLYGLDQAATS